MQRPPTTAELNLPAMHREEPQSEEVSSAEEGTPAKGSGWCGWVIRCLWESSTLAESTAMAKASRPPDDGQSREGRIQTQTGGRAW